MREERLYLEDICESIDKIFSYTKQLSFSEFEKDSLVIDAVIRNFEIIGEASKMLSAQVRDVATTVPWAQIIAMRNILSHEYFGAELSLVWKTIEEDLAPLRKAVVELKSSV